MEKIQKIFNSSVFGTVDLREKGERIKGRPSFLNRTSRTESRAKDPSPCGKALWANNSILVEAAFHGARPVK